MKRVDELLDVVMSEARAVGIPISQNIKKEVTINKRAKKRFGCCKITKQGFKQYFEIELAEKVANSTEEAIKQTLAHEVIHTCKGCANHGKLWTAYAEIMNNAYGYNVKRTDTAEALGIEETKEQLAENYLLICQNCGLRIARTRMSKVVKYPHRYRCKCGGRLRRVK